MVRFGRYKHLWRYRMILDDTWRPSRLAIKRYRTLSSNEQIRSSPIDTNSQPIIAPDWSINTRRRWKKDTRTVTVGSDWSIWAHATFWLAGQGQSVFLDCCIVLKGVREGVCCQSFAHFQVDSGSVYLHQQPVCCGQRKTSELFS